MTRLDRTLERDLRHIADRATPSPDAWDSILTRIADQDPHQETEIIMLTENTLTHRRWPLFAVAAAVAALAIAAIALVAGDRDDEELPAGPPPTQPETREPSSVEESPNEDAGEAEDGASGGTPEVITLTLTGTTAGNVGTNGVIDGDGGILRGTETWTGGADIAGLKEGTYSQQGTELSGELQMYLDGTIDGVGAGELTLAAAVELLDGTTAADGRIDGGTLVVTGEVVDGTGAFTGATGTFEQRGAFPIVEGTYTMELTVPVAGGPRLAHSTGTWGDTGYQVGGSVEGAGPELMAASYTTNLRGEVDGDAVATGYVVVGEDRGGATMEFTGTVAGLGTGTLTIEEAYVSDPGLRSVGVIVNGTGDLAGARGTLRFDDTGGSTYEMDIEVPADAPAERSRVVTLDATTESSRTDDAGGAGAVTYTAETVYDGGLSGTLEVVGSLQPDDEVRTIGWSDAVFTGSVEGVGSGTLTLREIWRSTESGRLVSMAVVTAGTGDLADADGWVRTVSEDDGRTGEATIELRLPGDA